MTSGPLSGTFSLLAQTLNYTTDCWQSALSKNKFIDNKFRICVTNKHLHHCLLPAVTTLEQKFRQLPKAQNAIIPTSRTINNADNFVNICIHSPDFISIYNHIKFSNYVFLFAKSKTCHICIILWEWYFDFSLKDSSFWLPYQRLAPLPIALESCSRAQMDRPVL